ncbi:alpha/beta fold hydrolase [Winogradskyella alexanderae]|uniref:Alpha/beta hydrolase n=1 Tax=Winogradskyella alexanderae TaxID=2877123 RepID=A0ABS7XQB9_9FLAO|nr:alpha/beta hydrolase [Winogradskyella alexanderae]MCA0131152.1 alpha/beta hydrolase [Winogradskyella alexanderae]
MVFKFKNRNLSYEVYGSGDVILLLHGFLENKSMWDDFIPLLSKSNKVITTDLLGHGKSESLGYIHTMEDMAEAVYAILSNLNILKVKVVGHSMGGYVALALSDLYPNFVTDVCLMNSTFQKDNEDRIELRNRAVEMAKKNYKGLVTASFANLFAPESRIRFKSQYDDALKVALQTTVQGYIAAQKGMVERPDRFDVFNAIPGQKHIIIGKKDGLVSADAIKHIITHTKIVLHEFSEGHMSHIENKSELSYFLNLFIEK